MLSFSLLFALGAVHALPLQASPSSKLSDKVHIDQVPRTTHPVRVASYPDGGYVSDINGWRSRMEFRTGMMLVINGKGFDSQKSTSMVGLFDGDRTQGAMLKIWDWSDTRIAAEIPVDQTALKQDTNEARLLIQGVRPNGVMTRYEVRKIRFDASR